MGEIERSIAEHGSTDLDLLRSWRCGNARAGGELIARHDAALRRYYRRRLGDDRCDDEAQRTWIAMMRSLDRFAGRSTVRTYLYAIAGNHVRESRRRDRWRALHDGSTGSLLDPGPSPAAALASQQEHQRLDAAMQRLLPAHRRLLELYYWEQRPAREIGELLGIPEDTARSRLRRAKQLLRETMKAPPPKDR